MGLRNFPDVYTKVTDKSYTSATASRFRCGLIGPAQKGPVNVATRVRSLRDFHNLFGKSLPGVYLANAVQLAADISDGITVVRVARQYEILNSSGASATGGVGSYDLSTPNAAMFNVGDYIRVSQIGKATSVNARVQSIDYVAKSLQLNATLQANYTAANVDRSRASATDFDPTKWNVPASAFGAANEAESFLYEPTWATDAIGGSGTEVTVSGTKSAYEVAIESNSTIFFPTALTCLLAVGDLVKLEQSGLETSRELMVKELVRPVPGIKGVIKFEPVSRSDNGYSAVSLQDSYTAAKIYKLSTIKATPSYHLLAANPGTWANSDGVRTGLVVKVFPGSAPDTKKFNVYLDSGLVEEIDNVSFTERVLDDVGQSYIDNPNFFVTRINGASSYIQFALADSTDPTSAYIGTGTINPPANTSAGWQTAFASRTNYAWFSGGYNGENVGDTDYIGTVDPVTELPTGLKIFEDKDLNLELDFIAAPGVISINVAMEMDRINRVMLSASTFDIPRGLSLRNATDWSNAVGLYKNNGKLDTYSIALFWNWGTMVDSWTGNRVVVPPTCGALRCLAYTFDAFGPGWAAAGETRGLIPEFLALEYSRSSNDAKQGSYRDGSVVNSIMMNSGRIMLFGNATTQRANSKLASLNNVVTVNTIVRAMAKRGRKYLFDPLDDILLAQMYQDYKDLLNGFKNNRMIEEFSLLVDKTNNTAADRNNRQANVDFSIIPIDALERLFVNATVRESGALINSINSGA